MQTFYYPDIPEGINPVATTGFFDGVHQGHRSVLSKLSAEAARQQKQSCVITFWPHPRIVLNKETENLYLLTTLNEKKELLEEIGIDLFCIIPFTTDFSHVNSGHFFKEYLKEKLNIAQLIIGYDHHFGHNREANFTIMQQLGETYGIKVEKVEASQLNFVNISSTKIRTALMEGNIALANALLGYSYKLSGTVVEGLRLGSKIGFPTANILPEDPLKQLPSNGVYAVIATVNGTRYTGMMNIGKRPTISNDFHTNIEVHLFNFEHNIYGQRITIECIERTRDELKFDSLDELAEQLKEDRKIISFILKNKV